MTYEPKQLTKADKVLFIEILKSGEITGKQKELIMEQIFEHKILLMSVDPFSDDPE